MQRKNKEVIENLCKFFSEMIDIIFGKYIESTEKLKSKIYKNVKYNN